MTHRLLGSAKKSRYVSRKSSLFKLSRAVGGAVFVGLAVGCIPYVVFWAVSTLHGPRIDYGFETLIAFWALMILVPFSMVPRKVRLV